MTAFDKKVLGRFKALLEDRVRLVKVILFGSRARGDAGPTSDMDVIVILDDLAAEQDFDRVSDCAWEAGFEDGIVIVPIVFRRSEWEDTPERSSLLAQAVEAEGVLI